jgi:hypothetical protein
VTATITYTDPAAGSALKRFAALTLAAALKSTLSIRADQPSPTTASVAIGTGFFRVPAEGADVVDGGAVVVEGGVVVVVALTVVVVAVLGVPGVAVVVVANAPAALPSLDDPQPAPINRSVPTNTLIFRFIAAAYDTRVSIRSVAAFAQLCGGASVPASSGKANRHCLTYVRNRAANHALWRIVMAGLAQGGLRTL